MASFVILLTARTARIACSDRHTYIHTYRQIDRQTHRTTTVTLAAHARRGLITDIMKSTKVQTLGGNIGTFGLETPIRMHMY